MIPNHVKPFEYQIPWKSNSIHFGDHRGSQRGLGFEFRGNVSLIDYPDARRLDLLQTVRDPYEQVQVKLFNQDNTTPVVAVCDLSSSMQFKGEVRKLDLAKDIAGSIAYSAHENSDTFSLIGYHQEVDETLTLSATHHIHQAFDVMAQMDDFDTMRVGAEGVLEVGQYLSQSKSLVFWVSDFHMPLALIEQALNSMSQHHVIPVVLWDDHEYNKLPTFGFGNMIDPETGMNKTVLFRKALKEQYIAAFAERKVQLQALFAKFDCQAIYINNQYDPSVMTQYFEEAMG